MSLKIQENSQGLVKQYWSVNNAYKYIIGNGDDDIATMIKAKEKLAKKILSDWVWGSNYLTIRYILRFLPWMRQHAYKRIYPTRQMAKIALYAEIVSNNNWIQETSCAKEIMNDEEFRNQVFQISENIYRYLRNTPRLKNILGNRTADYVEYYRGFFSIQGVWNILTQTVNQRNLNLTTNIAIIHDLAVLLKDVPKSDNDNFSSFNQGRLKMTVKNHQQVQEVRANNIDLKGNIHKQAIPKDQQMRWTIKEGGKFPDNRTIDENHPAIQYARSLKLRVQMGPSVTTASILNLAKFALEYNKVNYDEIITLLANLTLSLFAFWNQSYNRRCTLIHCYHFVTDCAVCNFGVPRGKINEMLPNGFNALKY